MKSPFPGMDPYIEGYGPWADFHHSLICEIDHWMAPQLPDRYCVRLDVREYTEIRYDDELTPQRIREMHNRPVNPNAAVVSMRAFNEEPWREVYLDILDLKEAEQVVTRVEMLAPANKRRGSEGWSLYLTDRQRFLLGRANFVELDLLRGGSKMPMLDPWPDSPYTLLVCRRQSAPSCRVWKGQYRHRLPTIPIPLRHPDADFLLDLQSMIDAVYKRSRYRQQLDYTKPLDPPLPAADAARLAEALKSP
jgi:hypothetical protein